MVCSGLDSQRGLPAAQPGLCLPLWLPCQPPWPSTLSSSPPRCPSLSRWPYHLCAGMVKEPPHVPSSLSLSLSLRKWVSLAQAHLSTSRWRLSSFYLRGKKPSPNPAHRLVSAPSLISFHREASWRNSLQSLKKIRSHLSWHRHTIQFQEFRFSIPLLKGRHIFLSVCAVQRHQVQFCVTFTPCSRGTLIILHNWNSVSVKYKLPILPTTSPGSQPSTFCLYDFVYSRYLI